MKFTNQIKQIKAKDTWELRQKVMWPEKSLDFVKLPNDEEGFHFGLFKNSNLVCVVSIFIDGNTAQFRKLATEKQQQGKGYASKLLEHIFVFLTSFDVTTVWCNARKDKIGFYEKFGLIPTNEEFIKGGIEFMILKKALN